MGYQISLFLSFLVGIHGKLSVNRQEVGDTVKGGYRSCSHGGTFYRTSKTSPEHCIYKQTDIECHLLLDKHGDQIPTIKMSNSAQLLEADLPWHFDCKNTLLKVRFWNYKKGKAVLTRKYLKIFWKSIEARLNKDAFVPKVKLRFKKHFPGLLVKFSIGCSDDDTDEPEYHDDDCFLVKFSGAAIYPLRKAYFLNPTITPVTSPTSPTASTASTAPTETVRKTTKTTTAKWTISTTDGFMTTKKEATTSITDIITLTKTSTQTSRFRKFRGNTTATLSPTAEKAKPLKRAIGLIVVFVLIVIILALLLCTYLKKSKKNHQYESEKATLLDNDKSPDFQVNHDVSNPVYDDLLATMPDNEPLPLFSPYDAFSEKKARKGSAGKQTSPYTNIDEKRSASPPPAYDEISEHMIPPIPGNSKVVANDDDVFVEGASQQNRATEQNIYDQVAEPVAPEKGQNEPVYAKVDKSRKL